MKCITAHKPVQEVKDDIFIYFQESIPVKNKLNTIVI